MQVEGFSPCFPLLPTLNLMWASQAHTLLSEHGSHRLGMALHGAHGVMAPLAVPRPLHLALLQLRIRHLQIPSASPLGGSSLGHK